MRSSCGVIGRLMRCIRSSTSTGFGREIRDKGAVTVKVAHLVIGVDVEGRKHALGCPVAETEGAKFWLSVLTQLPKSWVAGHSYLLL
jgi:Transposase, Mutator family